MCVGGPLTISSISTCGSAGRGRRDQDERAHLSWMRDDAELFLWLRQRAKAAPPRSRLEPRRAPGSASKGGRPSPR
eukprot:scaffold294137_cov14-Tisochrysis_lutea.AAC.2